MFNILGTVVTTFAFHASDIKYFIYKFQGTSQHCETFSKFDCIAMTSKIQMTFHWKVNNFNHSTADELHTFGKILQALKWGVAINFIKVKGVNKTLKVLMVSISKC